MAKKEEHSEEVFFRLNLEKIIDFVFNVPNDVNTEITETVIGDAVDSKVIHESKSDMNNSYSSIKYDLIKTLLSIFTDIGTVNEDGVTVGELTIVNTLQHYGFIQELK